MNRNILIYRVTVLFKSFIISHENFYTNGQVALKTVCIPFSSMMFKYLNVTTIFIVRVLLILCSENRIMIWYKLESVFFDLISLFSIVIFIFEFYSKNKSFSKYGRS